MGMGLVGSATTISTKWDFGEETREEAGNCAHSDSPEVRTIQSGYTNTDDIACSSFMRCFLPRRKSATQLYANCKVGQRKVGMLLHQGVVPHNVKCLRKVLEGCNVDAIESVKAQSRQDSIYLARKPLPAPENRSSTPLCQIPGGRVPGFGDCM